MLRISKVQINYNTHSVTDWERQLESLFQDIWDSDTCLVRTAEVSQSAETHRNSLQTIQILEKALLHA